MGKLRKLMKRAIALIGISMFLVLAAYYFHVNGGIRSNIEVLKRNLISEKKESIFNRYHQTLTNLNQTQGRILFVVTEDYEANEDGNEHFDATPNISDLSPDEVKIILIKKPELADRLANKYGIKWTHMVDVGIILLLKHVALISSDPKWNGVYEGVRQYLISTVRSGNDVQLHIHANNMPDGPIKMWSYNKDQNQIIMTNISEKISPKLISWASVFPELGSESQPHSRIGSLLEGKRVLTSLLKPHYPSYDTIFFRAGEWDFGLSEEEINKSFIALMEAGFLADSSISRGVYFEKGFQFGAPINANFYTIKYRNSLGISTRIYEILPVLPKVALGYKSYPITPFTDPKYIKHIYDSLFRRNKQISPGIHIIMEMFHVKSINRFKTYWISLNPEMGDWSKLSYHFRYIKKCCPEIEFVTITEALKIIKEYY
jgi:hypothetical protein